jgi:hypothetical protein
MVTTNAHVIRRNEDKLLLKRECHRVGAELDWVKFPGYLQIILEAPPNKYWQATGTQYINHKSYEPPPYREAVESVLQLMAQGLMPAEGTHHESTCECDLCEQGLDLPEINFSAMAYEVPDPEDLDA